ncbi:MAG TPA: rhodanese-like domain-containing protein, partial [Methanothrix sp.]|nr:rhodanese-like domain-containing protein [Methanothrix sp.]
MVLIEDDGLRRIAVQLSGLDVSSELLNMFPEIMYGSGERMMPGHMVCGVVTLLLLSSIMSVSGLSDVGGDGHAYSDSLQPEAASSGVSIAPANLSEGDTLLDVSPNATGYLDGAVGISYDSFLDDGGQLKPASKVAALLGESGIDENDSLVITGECLPCGMGPSPAFFTYWLLKYLGHENVKILQASADDLMKAGFNRSDLPAFRPAIEYAFRLKPDLLATYEFVAVGKAQIVDARPARDYQIGTIPGAINIPYEAFLDG